MIYVIAAALLALAGVGLYVLRARATVDLKREVVVTTKDDRSIRGILIDQNAGYLKLADARYLHEAQEHDIGEVRVPRANEAYTQLLGGS